MESNIAAAARYLSHIDRLVVLTGAGVSKESGIATFRDAQDGLWAQYDPMEMATLEGYLRNPALAWAWYEYRFGMVANAAPNDGHHAIAALERLIPHVTVVTQNIDGLHQAAGSTRVIELHGSIRRYKCISGRHEGFSPDVFAHQAEKPPLCPYCGDLLRPDVVWFGEYLSEHVLTAADDACRSCQAMLVVGTSGVVQPAASLPYLAARSGARVIDVNPEPDELSQMADVFLQGPGGVVLPQIVAIVRSNKV